jgi:hypothetical protein
VVPFLIRYTVEKPASLDARNWRAVLVRAWEELGRYLYARLFRSQKKFSRIGAQEYNYAQRGRTYQNKKNLRGLPPLVWSGTTRAAILSCRDVQATSKGMRLTLRGLPFYVNTPNMRNTIFKDQELTALSNGDDREATAFLDAAIERGINRIESSAKREEFLESTAGYSPDY